jgi:hypothetical protein
MPVAQTLLSVLVMLGTVVKINADFLGIRVDSP